MLDPEVFNWLTHTRKFNKADIRLTGTHKYRTEIYRPRSDSSEIFPNESSVTGFKTYVWVPITLILKIEYIVKEYSKSAEICSTDFIYVLV